MMIVIRGSSLHTRRNVITAQAALFYPAICLWVATQNASPMIGSTEDLLGLPGECTFIV